MRKLLLVLLVIISCSSESADYNSQNNSEFIMFVMFTEWCYLFISMNIDFHLFILVINFIMDISSPNNQESFLSDMNADGYINIQDIILIVNIILSN